MTTLSSIRNAAIEDAGAGGLTVYATKEDLPTSGLTAGDQAYVSANSRLYVSNGSGWYNIALINATPSLSIDPTGAISLSITGETTTITLTATDSDNAVAGLTYSVESDGSFGGLATLSQDSSVFTITPLSEDSATTTSAVLTFKASDGINFGSGTRTLTLTFSVENSNYTTLLLKNEETTDNQVDASTNALTITEYGNVTSTAFSPYHLGGYSTYFDGTGDYLTASTIDLPVGQEAYTIEAWVYATAINRNTICGWGAGSNNNANALRINDAGNGFLNYWYANDLNTGDIGVQTNTWYHVAATYDGTTRKIFVNGVNQAEDTPGSHTISVTNNFTIGKSPLSAADYMTGYISDLKISDTAVYTSNFTPPTERLTAIANTSLLTCHLPYIADGSTNGHTITVNGNTSTKRFGPYDYLSYAKANHGGSVYFDGTGDYLRTARLLETNSTTFTIEGWVYYSAASISVDVAAFFCDSTNLTGQVYGPSFGTNASQQLVFRWYNATSYTCTSSETVPYNVWTHIAAVVNNNSIQFYINGKAATMSGTTTYNGTNSAQTYAAIGGHDKGELTGYIADFRLTTSAVYTTDFTPPTAPLTAITNTELLTCTNKNDIWDAGSGSLLTKTGDVTGGGNSGTLKFGKTAVYFDGSGDYISAPTSDIFDLAGNVVWTIEGWFYWSSVTGEQILVEKFTGGTGPGWTLYKLNSSNLLGFYSGSSSVFSNAIGTVTSGQWYHVAVTRDASGTTRGFLNGSLNASGTYSVGNNSTGNLYIGARNGSASYMNGYVQDLRITKGLARYTANFTPPTAEFDG